MKHWKSKFSAKKERMKNKKNWTYICPVLYNERIKFWQKIFRNCRKGKGINMATIVDVAEYAGVSVATVSRMMNSPDVVSEKTKKKIHKAMQELHYQPNAMARALQQKKSNIIGLVLPYINYAFLVNLQMQWKKAVMSMDIS